MGQDLDQIGTRSLDWIESIPAESNQVDSVMDVAVGDVVVVVVIVIFPFVCLLSL